MEIGQSFGKEEFMTLFLAQIQNQNPLEPVSNEDFTQQLAMFTTVEELDSMNQSMESMITYQASTISTLAVGLIGREVTCQGDEFSVTDEGSGEDLTFALEEDAEEVTLQILNEEGKLVRELTLHELSSGKQSVSWDGMTSSGNAAPAGKYTFKVTAEDADGNSVNTATYQKGEVTGVTFEDGATYLEVNGRKITLSEIGSIG
jgi:flagellar basal-body rod modification protein FlgD